ncbi:MAG TPA: hypothetical protein VGE13_02785 [Candidatus Saccharimonadales bacterium]
MGKTHMDRVAFIDHLERKYSQKVRQHKHGKHEELETPASNKRIYAGDSMLQYEMTNAA